MKNQPKTNREIAEKISELWRGPGDLRIAIERALDAKDAALFEADKNGYERGRKDVIEDISDVIADDKHADNLAILRAVVQYIDKSRLDLRKANGK